MSIFHGTSNDVVNRKKVSRFITSEINGTKNCYNCMKYIGKPSNNKEVYMPAYEYVCKDCNHRFTVFISIKEFEAKPKIKCPQCQSDNVQKKLSEFTVKTSKKS
jgi:putative FmdB family regulatory protein